MDYTKQPDGILVCNKCGYKAPQLTTMRRHLQRKTPCEDNAPKRKCPYCDKKFVRESSVDAHAATCPARPAAAARPVLEEQPNMQALMALMMEIVKNQQQHQAAPAVNNMTNNIVNITNNIVNLTIHGKPMPECVNIRNTDNPNLSCIETAEIREAAIRPDAVYNLYRLIYANPNIPENHNISRTSKWFTAIADGKAKRVTDTYALQVCSTAAQAALTKIPLTDDTTRSTVVRLTKMLQTTEPHPQFWSNKTKLELVATEAATVVPLDIMNYEHQLYKRYSEPPCDTCEHVLWELKLIHVNKMYSKVMDVLRQPAPVDRFIPGRNEQLRSILARFNEIMQPEIMALERCPRDTREWDIQLKTTQEQLNSLGMVLQNYVDHL